MSRAISFKLCLPVLLCLGVPMLASATAFAECVDCDGNPCDDYEGWVGDGICDDGVFYPANFNCAAFDFDACDCDAVQCGDVEVPCDSEGDIPDCQGNCHPSSWTVDDICDDAGLYPADFNCAQFDFDAGACEEEPPVDPECGGLEGDVNADQTVNIVDVVALVNVLLDASLEPIPECRTDINGDDVSDVLDVVQLVSILLTL